MHEELAGEHCNLQVQERLSILMDDSPRSSAARAASRRLFVLVATLSAILTLLIALRERAGPNLEASSGMDSLTRASKPILATTSALESARRGEGALSQSSGLSFSVRVESEAGRPIGGGSIRVIESGIELGPTRPDGWASLPSSQVSAGRVLISAAGYVRQIVSIDSVVPTELVFRLREASALRGVVLGSDGDPVHEGMNVIATSPDYFLGMDAIRHSLRGHPVIPFSKTDLGGRFELSGCDPHKPYQVFAAGHGLAAFNVLDAPVSTSADVEVHAFPVYGARVRLSEVDGGELLLGAEVRCSGMVSLAPDHVQAVPLILTGPLPLLLGLETGSWEVFRPHDSTVFFRTSSDVGPSFPCRLSCRIPGYEPLETTLEVLRAKDTLPTYEILLRRSGSGFGSLTFVFGPAELVPRVMPATSLPAGLRAFLTPLGLVEPLQWHTDSWAGGIAEIDGIPFGDYDVALRAWNDQFRLSNTSSLHRPVRIDGSRQEFQVDLSAWGALELRVTVGPSTRYEGALRGRLIRSTTEEFEEFDFFGPPYTLPLLAPDEYDLRLLFLGSGQAELSTPARIVAGQTTTLSLTTDG